MPKGLKRFHSGGDEHFVTCSCYHRHQAQVGGVTETMALEQLPQLPFWRTWTGEAVGLAGPLTGPPFAAFVPGSRKSALT
jgi:hypothetical protein